MNPIAKNVMAVIAGAVAGCAVNMSLILIGPAIIPVPEGLDMTTTEGVREAMKTLQPQHFIFPWLAHALGTLVGAFVAAKVAASHQMIFALAMGVLFLAGGIAMVRAAGGPLWFIAADLVLAYIPMGYLGWMLACGGQTKAGET